MNLVVVHYLCLHQNTCGVSGSFWDLQTKLGDKPNSLYRQDVFINTKKSYSKPQTVIRPITDQVTAYLKGRKLDPETLEHFKVGSKDGKIIGNNVFFLMDPFHRQIWFKKTGNYTNLKNPFLQ